MNRSSRFFVAISFSGLFFFSLCGSSSAQDDPRLIPGDPVGFTSGDQLFPDFFAPSSNQGGFSELAWTRGDANTSFAAWENFSTSLGVNEPAIPLSVSVIEDINGDEIEVVAGIGNTPLPILSSGGMANLQFSPTIPPTFPNFPLITATRNLYTSANFGTLNVTATGEGLGVGHDTRVVVQVGTLGDSQNGDSFFLEYTDESGAVVTLSPIFNELLGLDELSDEESNGMGGIAEQRSVVWHIPGFNPDEYRVRFLASQFTSVSSVVFDSQAVPAIPQQLGDFSGNGVVDLGDITAWVTQFGTVGFNSDANDDTSIDAADFVILRDVLPPASSPTLASAAVPEPASSAVSLLCLLYGIAAKRRVF